LTVAGTVPRSRHLSVLDAGVTLSAPRATLDPIAFAYRRFEVARPPARRRRVALHDGAIVVDDSIAPIVPGFDPTLQLYQRFLKVLMDELGSHFLLHAAALADDRGRATLLAAPSGHGKSSLTLELLDRGLRFLSDDYAPLDPATGEIHPYPRALGLLSDPGPSFPERLRRLADAPDAVRFLGKTLVDVGDAFGQDVVLASPAALGYVLLLAADETDGHEATTWIETAAHRDAADRIEADLRAIDGVEIASRDEDSHLVTWRLRLAHDRQPTEKLAAVLDRDAVVLSTKLWTSTPDFTGAPRAVPVRRREAAEWLGREMLNRGASGRLLARYGGSTAAMFFDLARALANVECYRIRMGGRCETADLVHDLIRG
jgi:hypothetical protein